MISSGDKPKRREWYFDTEGYVAGRPRCTKVREVLPDDPDPEWVDGLIRLAQEVVRDHKKAKPFWNLQDHLAKRGEK